MARPVPLPRHAFARLLRETTERASSSGAVTKLDRILDDLFPPQRAFVLDDGHHDARRVVVRTPGRAGKTIGMRGKIMRCCLSQQSAKALYLGLSRKSAKDILWGELKAANQQYDLGATFNNSDLDMLFPALGIGEQPRCRIGGADDAGDIDKFRGIPQNLVLIDEAKSFPGLLLLELIDEVLQPRLNDRHGVLVLGGTPGKILDGPFYDASREGAKKTRWWNDRERPEWAGDAGYVWSGHTWTLKENTGAPLTEGKSLWDKALLLKKINGWLDDNPVWRREYLGQWVADHVGMVYHYNADINTWTPGPKKRGNPFGLPEGHDWHFVFGMDMGWRDPFSLQVIAFAATYPHCLQAYEFCKSEFTTDEIGMLLKDVIALCGGHPEAIVADISRMGGEQIATLGARYGIGIQPADQKQKFDNIALTNGELEAGIIKIQKGSFLAREMTTLQYDDKVLFRENKHQRNDNCDAFIYARRRSRHRDAREPEMPVLPGTPAASAAAVLADKHNAQAKLRAQLGGEDVFDAPTYDEEW